MYYRTQHHELTKLQLSFREQWLRAFGNFSSHQIDQAVTGADALLKVTEEQKSIETGKKDIAYFTSLSYLVRALLLLLRSFQNQLKGVSSADQRTGADLNADQFLSLAETLDASRPSIQHLIAVAKAIKDVRSIDQLIRLVSTLKTIALPVVLTAETSRYAHLRTRREEMPVEEEIGIPAEEKTVLSALFYLDNELWANPQIVKPNHLYSLSGKITLNQWPEGYDELSLSQVTTTNDDWYILSLPFIRKTDQKEIPLKGNITLKYAQLSMEAPISIRLLARFTGMCKEPLYVPIIGYNQLILRALGPDSFEFPTGFNKLNEKAMEISQEIQNELKHIAKNELTDFLILLSSILNYQGYCLMHGIYKGKTDITEELFRDDLIRYLSVNPRLSAILMKEGHLAGGRVEINFNGIIAELKVEKVIANRNKIVEKYWKQPAVYAAATGAQLSILCILDLAEKTHPPDIAAKNVFLVKPVLHGFEGTPPTSGIALVIIDGNTKNPSRY